tara:strand:+ start:445 stop:807 length:363 start_codon:yes stop_codon:yes gene_type:complete
MGIDAIGYFQARNSYNSYSLMLRNSFKVEPLNDNLNIKEIAKERGAKDATHRINFDICRYYSVQYPRGPFPMISSVLLELVNHPDVEKLWYGGDDFVKQIAPEDILKMTKFWLLSRNSTM